MFFEEDVLATQVIPGVEGVPSGEEVTMETEFATQPENQTAWGTEIFPTDVSLLSGGSELPHLLGHIWLVLQGWDTRRINGLCPC